MSESVEMELLINCTQATIQRFPWSTDYNTTVISELNRTEILDVLGEMITKSRSYVPKSDDLLTLRYVNRDTRWVERYGKNGTCGHRD
ncbi:hypothetical protein ZHAS_00014099 [Anopheles sinensis]|uniref:Uncharacterized protein n=1 Tax=Anopheles sinensis TaxID=74873 RepID=A0A084W7C6_ANOSI|nr:hypothetical protein ZHAS_00014099 [Anopheles sinensis]